MVTYSLSWAGSGLPHLSSISNSAGTPENYTFSTTTQTLLDPFTSSNFGTATILQSVAVNSLGIKHAFVYDSSAEMTKVTTPLGGVLSWTYATADYTARNYREVWKRSMNSGPGGLTDLVYIGSDSNPNWHRSALITNDNTYAQTSWTFSAVSDFTAGLATGYEASDTNGTYLQKSYAWLQSSSNNPYVATIVSTLNPGASYAASTTTTQQVDAYGNLTQQQVSDYSGSQTGARTYNMTYTASNGNYTAKYIFNRPLTATVTPSGGSAYTLSSTTYDGSCNGNGLTATSATYNHDSTYTTSLVYRGNPTSVSGLNSSDPVCTAYDSGGVAYYSADASGHSVSLATGSATNYSLPSTVTPNGNSAMNTTASYATSWATATMTGPNGDAGTTTYDSYGRPYQTTIPDGATTSYSYTYYNSVNQTGANTQTATVDGRWQTTTLDGFGRAIQVQKGNGSTVVSTVQTQYASAATVPLGKIAYVSEPYAPSASTYWTSYTYDGSGRKLTVTLPDGNSTTSYIYEGNSSTVTDPAGKWKTSTVDAYGNVTVMTEPNPAGGSFTTTYTFTPANQLTGVSMTRGNVTQTRTYLYSGSDMVSSTNPENGTVTYAYDSSHHVTTRTDAIGSQTKYTYDSYGRLSEVQYYPASDGGNEDTTQRVTNYYDSNYPCTGLTTPNGQYGIGRLSGVTFGGGVTDAYHDSYCYLYAYNQAGRVITQEMSVAAAQYYYNNIKFSASYQWDDEGRMTSLQYPTVHATNSFGNQNAVMPIAAYQYDANGRLSAMTMDDQNGYGPQPFASATYTAAGQLYQLSYGMGTETRQYNSLMQLTSQVVPGYLNMTYNYSSTQNNGRITSSVDGITGESTTYTYDALNRLTAASNSLWNEAYTYDGFGNLTSKAGSGGSPNTAPNISATYNAKNQQTSQSYDANGNAGGWTYSVENRLTFQMNYQTGAANLYAYDPSGKRVMSGYDPDPYSGPQPSYTYSFHGITGQRLATVNCNGSNYPSYPVCAITGQNVYFRKKLIVSGGVNVVTDRLGTVRANGQGESFAYYPYGEERTSTVNSRDKFGTYFRDTVGQDYADQRNYSSTTGQFWSPDPGGIKTADSGTPLSWNRYEYADGDPVNFRDPHGKFACVTDDNEEDETCDQDPDSEEPDPADGGGSYSTSDITAYSIGSDGVLTGVIGATGSAPDTVSVSGDADTVNVITDSASSSNVPPVGPGLSNPSSLAWPSTTANTCAYPGGGLLQWVCTHAGNGPVARSIRGCLQQSWINSPGYTGYASGLYPPAVMGSISGIPAPIMGLILPVQGKVLGIPEHAYCIPMGILHH